MSNRQLDAYLEHEHRVGEIACCECGFHRNGQHHPKIKCQKTGRCGECGNDWPCADHAPKVSERVVSGIDEKERNARSQSGCWRCDLGFDHAATVCARYRGRRR